MGFSDGRNVFQAKLGPFENFSNLLLKATELQLPEPTACSLATVTSQGQPCVRIVLFKGLVQSQPVAGGTDAVSQGFSFFTNYESDKAQQLAQGRAALAFFWAAMNTQVRAEGSVMKLSRSQSEDYFATRPRISQVGAWASPQSRRIANRNELENLFREVEARFGSGPIPCPPHWGGYALVPHLMEFWFAGEGRLHDRFVFQKTSNREWEQFSRAP